MNCYLWKTLFGAKESEFSSAPFELVEDDSNFLAKSTYSDLRRQYLLYPSKVKEGKFAYDDKMVKKILKKIRDRASDRRKPIKEKYYKKNLFLVKGNHHESEEKLYIVSDYCLILQENTTCNDVLGMIWHFHNGSL